MFEESFRQAAIAREWLQHGHELFIVAPELAALPGFVGDLPLALLQAPLFQTRLRPTRPLVCQAESLQLTGYRVPPACGPCCKAGAGPELLRDVSGPRFSFIRELTDLESLIAACDLFVGHAALGTLTQCLRHGKPVMVLPLQGRAVGQRDSRAKAWNRPDLRGIFR